MQDLLNWLFDIHQQGKVADLHAAHAESRSRVTGLTEEALAFELRYERLRLVTVALWKLLKDHTGLTEADLRRYVMDVDLLDGKADGKIDRNKGIINCESCNRRIKRSALVCVYCGERNSQGDSFHGT
jgi:hypothetical protein